MTPSRPNNIEPQRVYSGPQVQRSPRRDGAFAEALAGQLGKSEPVKLSAHAQKRLEQSSVSLSADGKQRLGQALDRMAEKGATRSLVVMDSLALVVSVKNRTVITAVDRARADEGAFTNIDSAIIV